MSEQLFLENTPIAIILAFVLVGLLVWRLKPSNFSSTSWQSIGVAGGLFWGILAAVMVSVAWESYYSEFVPSWYRFAAPTGAVLLYSMLGIALRWVAIRLPGNPVAWFCLLGGLESVPEHAVGIYRFHILELPILQGSSAVSIFIFAYFEYVIYWSIALVMAVGVDRLRRALRRSAGPV
jgi:hypothetical protein